MSDDEEPPIPSRELEDRYRTLVGDEPHPGIQGAKRGLIIVAAVLLSATFIAMCSRANG